MFVRCAAALFTDDEIAELQLALIKSPSAGDLIPRGRGLRKLRVPLTGRGKRGGARVIYYYWMSKQQCYLVYAYAKNAAADLSQEQLQRMATLMEEVTRHG